MPRHQPGFSQESNASATISPDRFSYSEPDFHHDDDNDDDDDEHNNDLPVRHTGAVSVFVSVESVPSKPTLPALLAKPGSFIRSNGPVKMPSLPEPSKKTGLTKKVIADIKKAINTGNQRINALQGAIDDHYNHASTIHKAAKGVIDEAWTMLSKRQREHAKDSKQLAKERNNNVTTKTELQARKQDITAAKSETSRLQARLTTMTARAKRLEESAAANKTSSESRKQSSVRSKEEEVEFLRAKAAIDVEKRLRIKKITDEEKEEAEQSKKRKKADRYKEARWGALSVTGGGMFEQGKKEKTRSRRRRRSRSHSRSRRRSSRSRHGRSRSRSRSRRGRSRSRCSRSRSRSRRTSWSDDDSNCSSRSRIDRSSRSTRSRRSKDDRRKKRQDRQGRNKRHSSPARSSSRSTHSRNKRHLSPAACSSRSATRSSRDPPRRDEAQRRYHQELLRQQAHGHRPAAPPNDITAEGSQVAEELTIAPLMQPYDMPQPDLYPLATAVEARAAEGYLVASGGEVLEPASSAAAEALMGIGNM